MTQIWVPDCAIFVDFSFLRINHWAAWSFWNWFCEIVIKLVRTIYILIFYNRLNLLTVMFSIVTYFIEGSINYECVKNEKKRHQTNNNQICKPIACVTYPEHLQFKYQIFHGLSFFQWQPRSFQFLIAARFFSNILYSSFNYSSPFVSGLLNKFRINHMTILVVHTVELSLSTRSLRSSRKWFCTIEVVNQNYDKRTSWPMYV